MEAQERREFFNILKGIGIFSIVVGHITDGVIPFLDKFHNIFEAYVYTFHLAIFFFVSGFFYNEGKYGNTPSLNFMNRFKRCWLPFFIYCLIVEFSFNLLPIILFPHTEQTSDYNLYSFIYSAIHFFLLQNPPAKSMSLWFIGPLIISSSLFGIIIYLSNKIKDYINKKHCNLTKKALIYKNLFIIFTSIALSFVGYYAITQDKIYEYKAETGLFVIPLLMLGYYTKTFIKNLNEFLNPIIAICFFAITLYLINFYFEEHDLYARIDLKYGKFTCWQYYVLSILGIYQIMYFAKIIQKFKIFKFIKQFLSYIGQFTFEIMAFHRVAFYILDVIFLTLISTKINNETSKYLFFFIYLIFSCLYPAIIKDKLFHLLKFEK